MIYILSIYLFILGILWASTSGGIEAILYSMKGYNAFKGNEHNWYTVQRVVVMQLIVFPFFMYYYLSVLQFALTIISIILAWNFFHDGVYYETRRRIDVPTYKWNSNANRAYTSAKINIDYPIRLTGFVISIIVLILALV